MMQLSQRWHPFLWALVGAVALFVILLVLQPELLSWLTTEEGPAEQVSHVALAAVFGLWCASCRAVFRASSTARAARIAAVACASYVGFLLMEEIHWGDIYGVTPVSRLLIARIGYSSIHALGTGMQNSLLEGTVLIALPLVAWFAIPLVPALSRRWSSPLSPVIPIRSESVAFLIVSVVYRLVDFVTVGVLWLMPVAGRDPFEYIDTPSLFDSMVYLMLGTVAWRVFRDASASNVVLAPPEVSAIP